MPVTQGVCKRIEQWPVRLLATAHGRRHRGQHERRLRQGSELYQNNVIWTLRWPAARKLQSESRLPHPANAG